MDIFFSCLFWSLSYKKLSTPNIKHRSFNGFRSCIFICNCLSNYCRIGDNDHPVTIVHYFMFIATLVGGIGSIFFWKTPELKELLLLISLGFFGFFGQYYMTLAFQNYKPHLVAPFKYVEVFFTFTMSIFLLEEAYDLVQILGAILIIVALLLNIWYKFRFK